MSFKESILTDYETVIIQLLNYSKKKTGFCRTDFIEAFVIFANKVQESSYNATLINFVEYLWREVFSDCDIPSDKTFARLMGLFNSNIKMIEQYSIGEDIRSCVFAKVCKMDFITIKLVDFIKLKHESGELSATIRPRSLYNEFIESKGIEKSSYTLKRFYMNLRESLEHIGVDYLFSGTGVKRILVIQR